MLKFLHDADDDVDKAPAAQAMTIPPRFLRKQLS